MHLETTEITKVPHSITAQVAEDLREALLQFKDPGKGLRVLSQKMGIHEKTLRRLMMQQNVPGYHTLYKIYRVLTKANNDTDLLDAVPAVIKEHIIKVNPKKHTADVKFNGNLELELMNDRVMGEIYFLAACGTVRRDEIIFRYGQFGLEALQRLLQLGALKETSPSLFALGPNQANYSAAGIKKIGIQMTESFFDPRKSDVIGENFIGIFAEGLSEEAYKQWLLIDKEAYYKKIALTKDPNSLGSVRALTFMVTDVMRINKEVL